MVILLALDQELADLLLYTLDPAVGCRKGLPILSAELTLRP